jgi:hypothetical protein
MLVRCLGLLTSRPLGVTIIGVIAFIGGLFGLVGGASVISGAAPEPLILGVVVVIFAFLGLALGIGFLRGKGWAWTLGVLIYVLSLPLGAAEVTLGGTGSFGGVVRVVVGLLILYYLTRPHVKAFFGK